MTTKAQDSTQIHPSASFSPLYSNFVDLEQIDRYISFNSESPLYIKKESEDSPKRAECPIFIPELVKSNSNSQNILNYSNYFEGETEMNSEKIHDQNQESQSQTDKIKIHEEFGVKFEVKKEHEERKAVEKIQISPHKRNQNAVKNYLPLMSKTFGYYLTLSDSEMPKEIKLLLKKTIKKICPNIKSFEKKIKSYISVNMMGKSYDRTSSKICKQYKITSKKDLERVIFDQYSDDRLILSIKEVIKELISGFLNSETFKDWAQNIYRPANEESRRFFLNDDNIREIIRVFCEPKYRPRFD